MRIEFLGSGGAITTPRPGCQCPVCAEARAAGVPYSRSGPSLFVHGPGVLIDTPEEAKFQLDRAGLSHVPACFYSHWHPDHVAGLRVWESLNADWFNWPPTHQRTTIYLPQQVAEDFHHRLGAWDQLMYLQHFGVVEVIVLRDGETVARNGVTIRPFRVAQNYVYAFLFEEGATRVLIAPDELLGWQPPSDVCGLDLAVLPMGLPEFDPLTGDRLIPADHPVLRAEATFAQTLDIVRALNARRTILTHIEEPFGLSHGDYERLAARLRDEGLSVAFAYDTLVVEV